MCEELVVSWCTDPGDITRDDLLAIIAGALPALVEGIPARRTERPCMTSLARASSSPSLLDRRRARRRSPTTTAYAVDPIPGPQTSGDMLFPNVGNGGYDVSDYDIDIVWTPGDADPAGRRQSIVATTTITAATTGAPLSSFSLDFEGLTVDSVTVNGTAATFTRVQDAGADQVQAGRHARRRPSTARSRPS